MRRFFSTVHPANYPENVQEEDRGADDGSVANIRAVRTAGVLLAQRHIGTSLITLTACLLTNIVLAVDSDSGFFFLVIS